MSAYSIAVTCFGLLALPAFFALQRRAAPYGRHATSDAGGLPSRLAWILMELPSALTFALVLWTERRSASFATLGMSALWLAHYVNRGLVYPLRIRSRRRVPLWIVISAAAFTACNGALNAWGLIRTDGRLGAATLIGAVVFVTGMYINLDADDRARRTPRRIDGGYGTPTGGLYRFVSAPNYLGEIIEWLGWALVARTSAAVVFFLWTLANLVPRAYANHSWCLMHIPHYPTDRSPLWPRLS